MERVTVIIIACIIMLGGCAVFEQKDYYGEAVACGYEPECKDLWDAWDRHEDLLLLREQVREFINSCPDGTYMVCSGWGMEVDHAAEKCVTRNRRCQCSCGTIDSNIY